MTREDFIASLNEPCNYFYTNDLLSSYYVAGNCIGKRRNSDDPQPDRGSILIMTPTIPGKQFKIKPYGWYDEMYFGISDINDDDSVYLVTLDGEYDVVNKYKLFLEDLKFWVAPLPELSK
ncbi:MAG: hypothetical protein ACOVNZ_12095 [Crocinitomicaceae bacterium]